MDKVASSSIRRDNTMRSQVELRHNKDMNSVEFFDFTEAKTIFVVNGDKTERERKNRVWNYCQYQTHSCRTITLTNSTSDCGTSEKLLSKMWTNL